MEILRRGALAGALALAGVVPSAARATPHFDHVVVVIMENKSYDEVRSQPYVASLIASGAVFPQSFAVTHPSQPNYFALWAGSTLGVTNDNCPAAGTPNAAENLGHGCEAAGLTWRAYSEDLPFAGATGCSYNGSVSTGLYTRKHDPWTNFSNVDHSRERPYADLAADLAAGTLPNLAFVIPNNCDNTHNSSSGACSIAHGDDWLHGALPQVIAALGPHGLLVLTWDEDDSSANNHILTVFAGQTVSPGTVSATSIDHYAVVRTICEGLGLATIGQSGAAASIGDVWATPVPALTKSWGAVKALYR